MSSNALKLVAVGFLKQPSHSILLQQCEELYAYGVLSQLARFTEIQYKDLVTLPDKISIQPELPKAEVHQKLLQICHSTRTRYIFTGAIMISPHSKTELYIHFQLFDSQANTFPVDETETLYLDGKHIEDENNPNIIDPLELNRLINLTTKRFLHILSPNTELNHIEELAPLSSSLQAIRLILRAHQTSSSSEKIMLYEAAIREDITLETAYYHLARIYKSENQYEKSILYYRETLKASHAANRNKAIYSTEAGICCALLGRPDLALQWWLRAIEYDANYISPYFNIANTYEDQNQFEQAETYFLKAQELAPDDFRTFFNLARIYSKMGTWDKALNQYQHQLKTESDDPWCHSDIATCYLNLGDIENAKRHLEKTLTLDPAGEAGQYAQLILTGFA
jgi:tetratricopeptide (TPR) repeat protein